MDVFIYAGQINMLGYAAICEQIKKKKSDSALLVLGTPGGDPHAGFRIARALQHDYDQFSILVPRYCKSAGTLLAIGAKTLYMADMSELGPLDIQLKKNDELIGFNSGLDITQAVNNLQQHAMQAFRSYLYELTSQARLATKLAADISTKLTAGLFEPIFGQIDPMRLAETQRAMEIAYAYGTRLNEKSNNLRPDGLTAIVAKYPSHSFVIDRKEARTIFIDVQPPKDVILQVSEALQSQMEAHIDSETPSVNMLPNFLPLGATNEHPSGTEPPPAGDPAGRDQVSGDSSPQSVEPAEPFAGPAANESSAPPDHSAAG